jgi:hypothetical protein
MDDAATAARIVYRLKHPSVKKSASDPDCQLIRATRMHGFA